jgi:prolyl-tRNA editing enzyme YbaK/EbsC (Cys-tRNA(Pro) deacylase)/predicted Fe-S protein YdhL (DUF1289 family)
MCGAELTQLPDGVRRVAELLQSKGHAHAPVMLDGAARTAQQAADALGVGVAQIAKSIIFRRLSDDRAVLVVTSGDQRVDEDKVAALVGKVGRADAAFVKANTGFSIGGVAPFAHTCPCVTLIDQELFRFEVIWAAAGHPHAVFKLSPQDLADLSDAPVANVVVEPVWVKPDGAHGLILERAAAVRLSADPVPSPCISVCRMNQQTQLCEGCYRSIDEICQWSAASDADKKQMWSLIEQRAMADTA